MPNVYLKNEFGEDIAYEGVDTVTLRKVEGGTARYTCGSPTVNEQWQYVQDFMNNSGKTGFYSKYSATCRCGKIVSCNAPNFGTWLQTTYDAYKLSNTAYYCLFTVPGGILLSTQSSTAPILFFDENTQELTQIASSGGYIQSTRPYKDKIFLSCYSRWSLFDPVTREISVLWDNGSNSLGCYCLEVEDGLLLSETSGAANGKGIFFLDRETLTLTRIFTEGYYWLGSFRSTTGLSSYYAYYLDVGDGILISSATSATDCLGILYYDKAEHTITRLNSIGYQYFNTQPIYYQSYSSTYTRILEDGIAITSSGGLPGLWWYKYSDHSLTQISSNGYYNYWIENDDVLLATYSSYGCSVYDKINKVWYNPATTGQYACVAFVDGGCVLGGYNASTGARYYDAETGEMTILDTTQAWRYACKTPDGCLMSATGTNSGIWKFTKETMTFEKVYETGYYWTMSRMGDAILIGSYITSIDGFLFYKDGTFTYHYEHQYDKGMRGIVKVDDGWVISGSYTSSGYCYFVDCDTGEVKRLTNNICNLGPYFYDWYGPSNSYHKPTYSYNKKFGDFRVLMSGSNSYGLIFDDVNHEAVSPYYWYNNSDVPESTPRSQKYLSMYQLSFHELPGNRVLILSNSSYPPILLDYGIGKVYQYQNTPLYVHNSYDKMDVPFIKMIDVDGGKLIFIPPYDWEKYTATYTSAQGIFYFRNSDSRLYQIYTSGYYTTFEESPGGGYIYLDPIKFIEKLYWDDVNHTITRISEQ